MRYLAGRFWIPPDAELSLADGGFLPDPEDTYAAAFNPEVLPLSAVSRSRCLVLIGEPGLGKTTALAAERQRVARGLDAQADATVAVDLGATRDERLLRARIFESEAFLQWQRGDGYLYLFLDSLDEARLRIETVADLLLDGISDADLGRLYLRLACRSADRHRRLEDALQDAFGSAEFGVFELTPLRRRDVVEAARAAGVNADRFVRDIVARDLQPLAIRPLTLGFLLRVAATETGLPTSASELYRRGCRLLVQEPDEDRRTGVTGGRLSAGERVAVAGRIAAATILSGRSAISTGPDEVPSPDQAELDDLAGGRELTEGTAVADSFAVDVDAVREVLGTGLFSARSEGRLGWAHQSLGEYLAAAYVAQRRMRSEQVLDLLTVREGDARRVIPQLREVAGWLATLSPRLFDALLPADPDVLLRGDVGLADANQREALVRALLTGVDEGTIDRWDTRIRSNLSRLAYPGVAGHVRDVLLNPAAAVRSREMAADLAGACRLSEVAGELADVACDNEAPPSIRQAAVSALDRWAEPAVLRRLVPLALEPLEVDVDDEIRGAALMAVWPGIIRPTDLFNALTEPRSRSLYGLYKSFLLTRLVDGLADSDVATALEWAAGVPRRHAPTDALSDVVQQILVRAWSLRSRPEVMDALVPVVRTFLEGGFDQLDHKERQRGVAFVDQTGRRELLCRLIPSVADGTINPVNLVLLSHPTLVELTDFEWLLEKLTDARGGAEELGWAMIIRSLLPRGVPLEPVMKARERSGVLRDLTSAWFDPVPLSSEESTGARTAWERSKRLRLDVDRNAAEAPDMAARVGAALDRFEDGDLDAFWQLNAELSVEQGGRHYGGDFQSDLTAFPGWKAADPSTRERIVAAARRYLAEGEPRPDEWFAQNRIWRPAWAGYRALRLLSEHHPEELIPMGRDPWERWSPIILAWPRDGVDEANWNDTAVAQCFSHARAAATRWFAELLDADLREDRGVYNVRRVRLVADAGLDRLVLERAKRDVVPVESRAELLRFLMERGSTEARMVAESFLSREHVTAGGTGRDLAIRVAQILVEEAPDAGWSVVWPLVHDDASFGRAVLEAVAQERDSGVADRLNEHQLAQLFRWLESEYPHAEDPALPGGAGHIGPREQLAWWRDGVLRGLAAKGTEDAIEELRAMERDLTDLPWIARFRREAEELLRRSRWTPPAPADVVRIAADAARRWVTTDSELREVVAESLRRAQEELQAATPAVADLWDSASRRPKSENELSDWLKRYLDRDLGGRGVVVGREVQIRPGPGGKMGESGDLVIDAIAGERVEGAPTVSVTVEVKGCWHPAVDTALRVQLAERYLLPEGERQGIYVVGWFAADDWDRTDWRRRACAGRDLESSRQAFKQQAGEVSAELDLEIDAVVLDCSLPPREGPARRS